MSRAAVPSRLRIVLLSSAVRGFYVFASVDWNITFSTAVPDAAVAVVVAGAVAVAAVPSPVAVAVAPAPIVVAAAPAPVADAAGAAETTRGCMRDHHLCATRFSFSAFIDFSDGAQMFSRLQLQCSSAVIFL